MTFFFFLICSDYLLIQQSANQFEEYIQTHCILFSSERLLRRCHILEQFYCNKENLCFTANAKLID